MRLSRDVLEALRETRTGWQGRADEALRSWIKRRAKSEKASLAAAKS